MNDEDEPNPEAYKVIDRRGTNPGRLESRIRPDVITEIKETADPMEWIAIFPGNRVQEQRFKLNRLEARGFKLLSRKMPVRSKDEQQAAAAARRKVLKVIERAVKVHTAAGDPTAEGVHDAALPVL